jgi:hypothetical protein
VRSEEKKENMRHKGEKARFQGAEVSRFRGKEEQRRGRAKRKAINGQQSAVRKG